MSESVEVLTYERDALRGALEAFVEAWMEWSGEDDALDAVAGSAMAVLATEFKAAPQDDPWGTDAAHDNRARGDGRWW